MPHAGRAVDQTSVMALRARRTREESNVYQGLLGPRTWCRLAFLLGVCTLIGAPVLNVVCPPLMLMLSAATVAVPLKVAVFAAITGTL